MALPWLGYIPVPGLSWLAVVLAPEDPLTRFHSLQATVLVAALYAWLLFIGILTGLSDAAGFLATMGILAGTAMVAAIVAIAIGIIAAVRGHYTRIRGAWDIMVLTRRA